MGVRYLMGMPGESYSGPAVPLSRQEMLVRENLQQHVSTVAGHASGRSGSLA